jgi:transcriptional regulator with XRE-family HTH domain
LIENSERTPGADTLTKLARALETTTDFLLGLSNDPNPRPLPNSPALLDPRLRSIVENWPHLLDDSRRLAADIVKALAAKEKSDEPVTQS